MPVKDRRSQATGNCKCCGSGTRSSTGTAVLAGGDEALYIARWTDGEPDHGIAFIIVPGELGAFISVLYSFEDDAFTVVGEEGYDWRLSDDGMRILDRNDVIGTPLAKEVFAILDEIWLHDQDLNSFHNRKTRR